MVISNRCVYLYGPVCPKLSKRSCTSNDPFKSVDIVCHQTCQVNNNDQSHFWSNLGFLSTPNPSFEFTDLATKENTEFTWENSSTTHHFNLPDRPFGFESLWLKSILVKHLLAGEWFRGYCLLQFADFRRCIIVRITMDYLCNVRSR